VRGTKFGKGRDLAVSTSIIEALAAYRRRRDRRQPATTRLFVSLAGTPVIYSGFALAFRQAVSAASVGAGGPAWPRVHDLRHRESRSTYRYLTATPEMLGHAAGRLEAAQEMTR
jgi:integrase